jgi:hypothetical protein
MVFYANQFDGPFAVKVAFLKEIFEDDFPERGMTAWFIRYEWSEQNECYKLYFDFTDFEEKNEKYFTESYYENIHTRKLVENGAIDKKLWTAKEAGYYSPKYSVYFSIKSGKRNDEMLNQELKEYLKILH